MLFFFPMQHWLLQGLLFWLADDSPIASLFAHFPNLLTVGLSGSNNHFHLNLLVGARSESIGQPVREPISQSDRQTDS